MKVTTHITASGAECHAHTAGLGERGIPQARNEYQAQHKAARFLAGNPLSDDVEWVGGYHGGPVDSEYKSTYYGD